ncbi:MAG: hypothetical protein JRI68_29825, partial [Deltaproteobacteria bacterium]|nr:hypothetical protein [Deltaproteobacteria bacterium]
MEKSLRAEAFVAKKPVVLGSSPCYLEAAFLGREIRTSSGNQSGTTEARTKTSKEASMLRRTLTGLALAVAMVWGSSASAMTSVEGTAIGDQGFYWTTPAEVWIFPHRIGNIDNRVMFQWHDATPGSPLGNPPIVYNVDGLMTASGVVSSVQGNAGGGFVVELIKDLNLGLWLSGYNPGHNAFVGRGIAATGWDTYNDGIGDMAALNIAGAAAGIEAGRKVDLFVSYWLSDLDIEAGLRFWYGSAAISNLPDESAGPVDIDADSNPTTDFDLGNPAGGREELLEIDTTSY